MIQKTLFKSSLAPKDLALLASIFGGMGILGTYTGLPVKGALVNARAIGVFVGGLLGGPLVGLLSGLIAGGHRYLIDIGGFTAVACSLSTVAEGVMAGLLKEKIEETNHKVLFSIIAGMLAEIMQMAFILLIARPYPAALDLVKTIAIPMILANGLGIGIFVAIAKSIYKEIEKEGAYQAQVALKIADKTLKYFRRGYNKENAEAIAHIIKDTVDIDAVAFTDREKILAHVGVGDDHHKYGSPLQTEITKHVINSGRYKVSRNREEINCSKLDCPLRAAVIVPLKDRDRVVGALKLYKVRENAISKMEVELALGLAQVFSTQVELRKIDIQNELLAKSELKALQAQINPHFLFNAINTISSLIRTSPEEARELLIHLGNYFRNNLSSSFSDVSLKKELENVNSYVSIEKARFGDKLRIVYNIPKDLDCYLPALIIQPIVENAIKHGIFNSLEGGTVEIQALDRDRVTEIYVRDDGIGMDQELINYLLASGKDMDKIGIRNVNERLKNKYGDEFGLRIKSRLGDGTEVKIVIPKQGVIR